MDTLKDMYAQLLDPWLFMSISASHIPLTIRTLLSTGSYTALLSPTAFADALFGHFWATVGPSVKSSAEQKVVPLLEGRVSNGVIVQGEKVAEEIGGVVIEIGAGSGQWADTLAKIAHRGGKIERIYGVEPNLQNAASLRLRTKEVGLEDVYQVLPLGIEDLADPRSWPDGEPLKPGSVDCIVSILCMCSVPDQAENCKRLYELLKPGGRWYVYEHVRAERGGIPMRLYQRFVNIFWSFFLGSCRLCKPTGKNLLDAGLWTKVDLKQPPTEPAYHVVPHVLGVLTK